jgi:hypothetical protein
LQSIIDQCRICGTEGETIEHIISSCTVLAQSEYKKRHDIFAKIIHMNLAVNVNLKRDTDSNPWMTRLQINLIARYYGIKTVQWRVNNLFPYNGGQKIFLFDTVRISEFSPV